MKVLTPEEVRSAILALFEVPLRANGMDPKDVPDDYDLLTQGVIDSLGMVAMVGAAEDLADCEIDFEDLDFEDMTIVGKFCDYVAYYTKEQANAGS